MIGRVLLLFVFLLPRFSMAGVLTGNLDRSSGSTEEQFQYILSIQGSVSGQPKFPDIPGLRVVSTQQSSSMSIINGRRSSEVRLTFILKADKEGTYTIPPISLMLDNKLEKTLPLKLTVRELSPEERRQRPLYAEQSLSKTKFFQGESVILTVSLYSRYQLKELPKYAPQAPAGVRVTPLGEAQSRIETIGENQFQIVDRKFLLVADDIGFNEVPPSLVVALLSTGRRSFFSSGVQQKTVPTNSLSFQLETLPAVGRTPNFSGLVGQFKMEVEVPNKSLKAGDNYNIAVLLRGDGESKTMKEPQLRLEQEGDFKVYKDKPVESLELSDENKVSSETVFNIALVPQHHGKLDLGRVSVEYFDTSSRSYKVLEKSLGTLDVRPNPAMAQRKVASVASIKSSSETLSPDTLKEQDAGDLHEVNRLKGNHLLTQWQLALGSIMILLSILGIPASWILYIVRNPSDAKRSKRRKSKAYKLYLQKEKAASKNMSLDIQKGIVQLQDGFKDYLGDKLNIQGKALTEKDISAQLRAKELPEEHVASMLKVYRDMDAVRYSGKNSELSGGDLLNRTRSLIQEMEKSC